MAWVSWSRESCCVFRWQWPDTVFSLQVEKTVPHLREHDRSCMTETELLCVQVTVARHPFQPTGEDSTPPTWAQHEFCDRELWQWPDTVFGLQVEKTAPYLCEHSMRCMTMRQRLCVQVTVARHCFQPTGEDSTPSTWARHGLYDRERAVVCSGDSGQTFIMIRLGYLTMSCHYCQWIRQHIT